MKQYIKEVYENMKRIPDEVALVSEGKSHGLTYGVLDRNSGKVYSWLKAHGIGREDMVLVCLPRGVRIVVAMIGILRAGAAFTVVESAYSPKRIEFIKKDCGCILTIDEEIFMEMMEADYLDGFEETDPHDMAYAVYTSGTTGTPKGVIHEYGNLGEMLESLNYEKKKLTNNVKSKFAFLSPMNFVAAPISLFFRLALNSTVYIVPYSVVKNMDRLQEYLYANEITDVFMTPSMARIFKNPAPSLKGVVVSSEPAHGIFMEGINMYNIHSMSETGFVTAMFKIDKLYDEVPIGKPQFDLGVYILDEQGKPVPDGEIGEYCFDNKYVRGYINLPEKTAKAFRNGIFHSGDLARRNPDGNIVILGRNDDMIKINGNRIEPAEIETALRATLGLSNVVVKGFNKEKRAFVCAYYLKSDPKAAYVREMTAKHDELNESLLKIIPYYMLPTYYVELNEFPVNENGKLSRKSLEEPDAALYRRGYRAPSTELEKKLCVAFEKVLDVGKIGVDDDFYLLGGDSISALALLNEGGIPGFEAGDLFKYHTPAKIASALSQRKIVNENLDEEEAKARKEEWQLNQEQIFSVDFQFEEPKSTMWNLTQLFRMKGDVDADRLAAALEKAMRNHGAFFATIGFNEDCEMVFRYTPEAFRSPEIINISEDELQREKYNLRKPFTKIIGEPLYRCRIYKTEKNVYLFMDVWHVIADGTSLRILRDEIYRCYMDPDAKLKKDYFYLVTKRHQLLKHSETWKDADRYYQKFDKTGYDIIPKPDNEEFNLKLGQYEDDMGLDEEKVANSPLVNDIGRNAFFILAFALATAVRNNCRKQVLIGLFNGRDSAIKSNTFSLIFRAFPAFIDFDKSSTLGELRDNTKEIMKRGLAFCDYPATEATDTSEAACLIYQKNIYNLGELSQIVEESIDIATNDATDGILVVNVIEEDTAQHVIVDYASEMYKQESIAEIMKNFSKAAELLLEYGDRPETEIDEIFRRMV